MTKADILIAEDDPILRDLYLRKFDKKKFDVRTALNGEETLKMLEERTPNVLLLDINMPVMDGVEVLRHLPKKRSFKIIILTNHEEQLMRDQMGEMGVDGYFVKKDMTLDSLLEMAEGLLPKGE